MLLALKKEGVSAPAVLSKDNKLEGQGPYRMIVPQKAPSTPDQSSKALDQDVLWPYKADWDHNAGSSTRSATMIRVEPRRREPTISTSQKLAGNISRRARSSFMERSRPLTRSAGLRWG